MATETAVFAVRSAKPCFAGLLVTSNNSILCCLAFITHVCCVFNKIIVIVNNQDNVYGADRANQRVHTVHTGKAGQWLNDNYFA